MKPRVRVTTGGQLLGLRPQPGAQYMGGGASPFFIGWNPALRDQRYDVRAAYTAAAARAIDALHNSGWLAGAVQQSVGAIIGTGLKLASKPDYEALGWTADASDEFARLVERRWEAWSGNPLECDAGGRWTVAQMTEAVVRLNYAYGESLALLPAVTRPESRTRAKVHLLPPHRLTQDSNGVDLFQGVRMGDWGLPIAYRIQLSGIAGENYAMPVMVRARDGAGRPQVAHIFNGGPGQTRGISPLAPVLKIVRQYDQLADATLQAALIQAIFAATIQSNEPTKDVMLALQDPAEQGMTQGAGMSLSGFLGAKADWYEHTTFDFGRAGRVAHLFPGESLDFHRSEHPNSTYEAFASFLLREIARCLGLSFETVTGDYRGATYSSVRMSTSENWPIVLGRRKTIAARFVQTVFEAWLEEEIETGRIPFPGGFYAFLEQREAVCRADWRGPPKPQADDLKLAMANKTLKAMGVVSDEMVCSDYGADVEDVYRQRAREAALRKKLGLPEGDTFQAAQDDRLSEKLVTQD